ncbi:PoNe immunity protein domain-containing protein [Acinetobacter gerneri]|uniref:PoNe immunity protein domain-containing protein n=1 Tax=Acinetobacter gerneri TaxID=202952 RepID=UPI0028A6F7CE|nr:PoNe immunity protein domain-containing protein [Acinetobacter gerneri]
MENFENKRRQQFLSEEYFTSTKNYQTEGVSLYLESDAFEDDKYNCGESERWSGIKDCYWNLLFLEYTAGSSIEQLILLFEQVVNAFDKKAEALAIFEKGKKPSVIPTQNETLNIISLAYLLDKEDLLPVIHQLVNGEDQAHINEDEIINKFFGLNDPEHPIMSEGSLYDLSYSPLCDVIDNVKKKNDPKHALELFDEYLSSWYKMNKNQTWYNSHLDLEGSVAYSGYWAFEAAALVYLLDLDDSCLHKYLFYPKDIVQWIRHKRPVHTQNKKTESRYDDVVVHENEKVEVEGYYEDSFTQKIIYLTNGDIGPAYPPQQGANPRVYVWRKLSTYGLNQTDSEILRNAKNNF